MVLGDPPKTALTLVGGVVGDLNLDTRQRKISDESGKGVLTIRPSRTSHDEAIKRVREWNQARNGLSSTSAGPDITLTS